MWVSPLLLALYGSTLTYALVDGGRRLARIPRSGLGASSVTLGATARARATAWAIEQDSKPRWYVLNVQGGKESAVRQELLAKVAFWTLFMWT